MGKIGQVIVRKMRMMKEVEHIDGFRKIFPNFRHGNRLDGFGCPSLSPMSLGPVIHGEKGLPNAKNIENWHQFAKVYYPQDVDDDQPNSHFFDLLKKAYQSEKAYRHKYDSKSKALYSFRIMPDGEHRRYTYVESRYFYCKQYEILSKETKELEILKSWINDGMNLQIVGYDGFDVENLSLIEIYKDPKRIFGHELVLYSILTIDDPDQYPWNLYKSEFPHLYEKLIF